MADDEMEYAEYGKSAEHRGQPVQLGSEDAEHPDEAALREQIEQRVVRLEVRYSIHRGVFDILRVGRWVQPSLDDAERDIDVRPWPQTQHPGLEASAQRLVPGMKPDGGRLLRVGFIALGHVP